MGPRGSQHFPSDGLRQWLWLLLLHKSLTRKQAKNPDISCEQHSKRANIGQKKLWHNRSYGRSTSFFVLDNVIKERCHCVAQAWVLLAGYLSADIICFEKRELRGKDNVLGQISEHSVASNGGYCVYYPSNLFATHAVLKIGEYSPLGNIRSRDVFRPIEREQKYFMDYMNNSHHLARKYVRMFVRGHYLFREANSFPRAKLEENCELRGRDNIQGQISELLFAPNGGYCLYYPSNLFSKRAQFSKLGNI